MFLWRLGENYSTFITKYSFLTIPLALDEGSSQINIFFSYFMSGPEVIKLFSCSTQLSMKCVLLIKPKLLTTAIFFLLNIADHENFSVNYCWHFHIC